MLVIRNADFDSFASFGLLLSKVWTFLSTSIDADNTVPPELTQLWPVAPAIN